MGRQALEDEEAGIRWEIAGLGGSGKGSEGDGDRTEMDLVRGGMGTGGLGRREEPPGRRAARGRDGAEGV